MLLMESDVELVRCNLCGATESELLYRLPVLPHQRGKYGRDIWEIVRCRRCGLVYENPQPSAAHLQNFHALEDAADAAYVQDAFINSATLQHKTWQRLLRIIQAYCPHGTLLDIGCGSGSFLVTARQAGFDVRGQDISPYFVRYCRTHHGLEIFEGNVATLAHQCSHQFDCVTLFDVIEHHPDPRALLAEIKQLLKPNGIVVIGTPDIGSFFARLYGARWRQLHAIGHLTYFSRSTLIRLLEKTGFQVLRSGGLHTIDWGMLAEQRNRVSQFFKLIGVRAIILVVYKPVALRFPLLQKWHLTWRNTTLNHELLLIRTGGNIIMNDNVICVAASNS